MHVYSLSASFSSSTHHPAANCTCVSGECGGNCCRCTCKGCKWLIWNECVRNSVDIRVAQLALVRYCLTCNWGSAYTLSSSLPPCLLGYRPGQGTVPVWWSVQVWQEGRVLRSCIVLLWTLLWTICVVSQSLKFLLSIFSLLLLHAWTGFMYSSSMLLRMKAMYFGWNFKYFPLIENVHVRMTSMSSNMISTLTIYSTAITYGGSNCIS